MNWSDVLKLLDDALPPPNFYGTDQLAVGIRVANISAFAGVVLASALKFRLSVKIAALIMGALLFGIYWGVLRNMPGVTIFWIQQIERALCLALLAYALTALIGEGVRKAAGSSGGGSP